MCTIQVVAGFPNAQADSVTNLQMTTSSNQAFAVDQVLKEIFGYFFV